MKNKKKRQHKRETDFKQLEDSWNPVLRFTPYAWSKLHWFCHHGETEIGGFGITDPDELLLIRDFVTVSQSASPVSVRFDDSAVADFFDEQVDADMVPEQFGRIWLHTHPGGSPRPSDTDEQTFDRVFGNCHWAVMFILARGGKTYARQRFNVGPQGQTRLRVRVDYDARFEASDHFSWEHEYMVNVRFETPRFDLGLDVAELSEVEIVLEDSTDGVARNLVK